MVDEKRICDKVLFIFKLYLGHMHYLDSFNLQEGKDFLLHEDKDSSLSGLI